jgi:hypothetical protein
MECQICHEQTRNPQVWRDVRATAEYRAEAYTLILCPTCFERRAALHALELARIENCL